MTQATTATQKAAEMPDTVLTPTTRKFSQKFTKNSSQHQKFEKKYLKVEN
jgi:hypothetical protein